MLSSVLINVGFGTPQSAQIYCRHEEFAIDADLVEALSQDGAIQSE
jgi:hypothetical protein